MNDLAISDERLRPASMVDIAEVLTRKLFLAFDMKGPDDEDKQRDLLVIYVEALSKYPLWATTEAIRRFISGEVKAANKKFAPKPAELCEVVREVLAPVAKKIATEAYEAKVAAEVAPTAPMQEAERKRMQVKTAVWAKVSPDRAKELLDTGKFQPWLDEAIRLGVAIPEGIVDDQAQP